MPALPRAAVMESAWSPASDWGSSEERAEGSGFRTSPHSTAPRRIDTRWRSRNLVAAQREPKAGVVYRHPSRMPVQLAAVEPRGCSTSAKRPLGHADTRFLLRCRTRGTGEGA